MRSASAGFPRARRTSISAARADSRKGAASTAARAARSAPGSSHSSSRVPSVATSSSASMRRSCSSRRRSSIHGASRPGSGPRSAISRAVRGRQAPRLRCRRGRRRSHGRYRPRRPPRSRTQASSVSTRRSSSRPRSRRVRGPCASATGAERAAREPSRARPLPRVRRRLVPANRAMPAKHQVGEQRDVPGDPVGRARSACPPTRPGVDRKAGCASPARSARAYPSIPRRVANRQATPARSPQYSCKAGR